MIALSSRWDAVNETCWYRSTDPKAMLRWLIGTQTFWIVLFAAGEVAAFLVIVGYLISYMVWLCPPVDYYVCNADHISTARNAALACRQLASDYRFI